MTPKRIRNHKRDHFFAGCPGPSSARDCPVGVPRRWMGCPVMGEPDRRSAGRLLELHRIPNRLPLYITALAGRSRLPESVKLDRRNPKIETDTGRSKNSDGLKKRAAVQGTPSDHRPVAQ